MALGKAYIEVHADTAPFARELGDQLEKIVSGADAKVKASSRKVGETVAKETGVGIEKDKEHIRRGFGNSILYAVNNSASTFGQMSKGIIDTIDDGLSGLPDEVKVILGAALLAALPVIYALGSAIAGALTAGLAAFGAFGLGALMAAQFKEVQTAARDTFAILRDVFLGEAQSLVRPFLNGLELVRTRLSALAPETTNLFARIGDTIVPIFDAFIGAIEEFVPLFRNAFANIGSFLAPIQIGFRLIGRAAGQFFETILSNDDAPEALYDLFIFVEDLIQGFTILVDIGLDFYGTLRDIAEFLGIVEPYSEDIKKFSEKFGIASEEASTFGKNIQGTIDPLEAQATAIEETNKQLKQLTDLLFDSKQNEIDFERALDGLTESVKENGRSLDIQKEAGRQNAEQLLSLAQIAINTRQTQIDLTGDVIGAQLAFEKQRAKIYEVAKQMGLSKTATEKLIGALLDIPPPKATGVTPGSLNNLNTFLATLRTVLRLLPGLGVIGNVLGGVTPHAAGGVFTQPHVGLVAEAGPEAIIPLNNPQRAAQVMAQAGLSGMTSPVVNVYIGNQQIDAYIDTRVNDALNSTARSLTYGMRGI